MYVSWIISVILVLLYIFDSRSNNAPSMPTSNSESLETKQTLDKMIGMAEKLQSSNEKLWSELQSRKLLDLKQSSRTSTKGKNMMTNKDIMDFDLKLFDWSNRNNETEVTIKF